MKAVCGTSQPSKLNFFLGMTVGLVVSFLLVSYTTLQAPSFAIRGRLVAKAKSLDGDTLRQVTETKKDKDLNLAVADFIHSHEELDKHVKPMKEVKFEDEHAHHDDDSEAQILYKKVRVLCWIMTHPGNLDKKAIHVKKTWGKRCNIILFFSSVTNSSFPTIGLNVSEGREHLTAKTMQAFKYVFENYAQQADWFMKADDDTYVILENLRYFLSSHSPEEPIYFGHHFKTIVKQGYFSGGAGYVLSKEALRRYANKGNGTKSCRADGGAEDAEFGFCMERLGVKTGNSTDRLGRSRFHCFDPETHLFGGYPDWYYQYDANGAKKGTESVSDYAISFHYVPPNKMYALEFYIYHLRPYGISSGHQDLNHQ